jgi:hypothetical protein
MECPHLRQFWRITTRTRTGTRAALETAEMNEPYEVDVAPNGNVFVSQCGWGRRFPNMDAALGYISMMESLNEENNYRRGSARSGIHSYFRSTRKRRVDFEIGIQSYSGGTV